MSGFWIGLGLFWLGAGIETGLTNVAKAIERYARIVREGEG